METLIVDALAAHRITRLIVSDVIADRPRARVMAAAHEAGFEWLKDLIRCSWCTGVHVGFAVVAARAVAPKAWQPIARALALADVAGIVASFVP